jgi:hypothetical protein
MAEEMFRESLMPVVTEAWRLSSGVERVLAGLPGFRIPWGFWLRRRGERVPAQWGVPASAHLLIAARWRQAALLLVIVGVGGLITGVGPFQAAGVVVDALALGCAARAARRRKASGIPLTRRLRGGGGAAAI